MDQIDFEDYKDRFNKGERKEVLEDIINLFSNEISHHNIDNPELLRLGLDLAYIHGDERLIWVFEFLKMYSDFNEDFIYKNYLQKSMDLINRSFDFVPNGELNSCLYTRISKIYMEADYEKHGKIIENFLVNSLASAKEDSHCYNCRKSALTKYYSLKGDVIKTNYYNYQNDGNSLFYHDYRIAFANYKAGNYSTALSILEDSEDKYFSYNLLNYLRARIYFQMEKYDQALNYAKDFIEYNYSEIQSKDVIYTFYLMGKIYNLQGEYENALTELRKSYNLLKNTVYTRLETKVIEEIINVNKHLGIDYQKELLSIRKF